MEELLGRRVPHSAAAEQAVVGSMLIYPRCVPEVLEVLKADEFYVKLNRDIYETVFGMFAYGHTIDPVTILDQMRVRGVYDENCESYIAELKRVTWPSKKELISATLAVLAFVAIAAVIIGGLDVLFGAGMRLLVQ